MRGLGISQVPSSHVGPSIVIWLNTIYYTTDQPFTWRSGKSLVHSVGTYVLFDTLPRYFAVGNI